MEEGDTDVFPEALVELGDGRFFVCKKRVLLGGKDEMRLMVRIVR